MYTPVLLSVAIVLRKSVYVQNVTTLNFTLKKNCIFLLLVYFKHIFDCLVFCLLAYCR